MKKLLFPILLLLFVIVAGCDSPEKNGVVELDGDLDLGDGVTLAERDVFHARSSVASRVPPSRVKDLARLAA